MSDIPDNQLRVTARCHIDVEFKTLLTLDYVHSKLRAIHVTSFILNVFPQRSNDILGVVVHFIDLCTCRGCDRPARLQLTGDWPSK